MTWKNHLLYFVYKRRQSTTKSNQKFWGSISILIFSDNAQSEPKKILINNLILIFLGLSLISLPALSAILYVQSHLNGDDYTYQIETRHRLINLSIKLTIEKKRLIDIVQTQLQYFHNEFSSQKKYSLETLLKKNNSTRMKEKETKNSMFLKPGIYRSHYELEFLLPLKEKMKDIISRQIPFIFRPIWSRMMLYHITPRGWALLGGVGNVTSLYGNRKNPLGPGGEFHSGIDFAYLEGTPIIATAPGIAIRVVDQVKSGYGKFVRLHHGFGFTSLYAHCQSVVAKEGDYIEKGEVIGYVGRTGRSTGDHLHYEIQIGLDKPSNPLPYLKLE